MTSVRPACLLLLAAGLLLAVIASTDAHGWLGVIGIALCGIAVQIQDERITTRRK